MRPSHDGDDGVDQGERVVGHEHRILTHKKVKRNRQKRDMYSANAVPRPILHPLHVAHTHNTHILGAFVGRVAGVRI